MKNYKPILLFLFVLGVASSCRKAEPVEPSTTTEVYGRVLLRGTNHKATSEVCTIRAYYEHGASDGGISTVIDQVGEGFTDSEGNFRFSFEYPINNNQIGFFLRLETEIENHFRPEKYRYNIKHGKSQSVDLFYTANAWLKLHYKNVNPEVGDVVRSNLGGGVLLQYFGPADQQYIHKVGGNVDFEFSYTVIRNGVPTQTIYPIFAPAFDTIYHLIEY